MTIGFRYSYFIYLYNVYLRNTKKIGIDLMVGESKIISLLRNRNQRGMTLLYEQYSDSIFGVILRIISDRSIAEEVLQQSFLKAWNKIDSYNESKSSLYTWLSAIARNSSIDKVRLKSFQSRNKTDSFDTTVHNDRSVNTNLDHLDTKKLLKDLDPKYRVVLDMMYLQGYSQSEIAEKLEIPLGTIKTRARSAIKFLREELKNEKSLFLGFVLIFTLILLLWQ